MLTGAFLYLPLVFVPEADSLKHPQSFYLTKISPQTVLSSTVNIQLNQWRSLYLPPVFNAHDRHEHP